MLHYTFPPTCYTLAVITKPIYGLTDFRIVFRHPCVRFSQIIYQRLRQSEDSGRIAIYILSSHDRDWQPSTLILSGATHGRASRATISTFL
jgi:hypothetical protein